MNTFRVVTANTLYQGIGKIISLILSIITTSLLTRNLGQAGYGQYTLIATIIILFGSITDWGTGFIAARMVSQGLFQHDKVKITPALIYGNLILSRLFFSLIGVSFMLLLAWLQIIKLPLSLVFVGSLIIFALTLRNTMQVIFQVHLKLQYSAIVEVLTSIVFLLLTWWSLTQTTLTPQLAITYLLTASLFSGVFAVVIGYQLSPISYVLNVKIIKYLIKESAPMGTLLLVFSIYNRLDSFILQHFHGDQSVGVYALAYKIHDNAVMGSAFFMNALYPLIAKSGKVVKIQESVLPKNHRLTVPAQTQHYFSTAFHLLLLGGIVVATLLTIFAQPIVLLLADPSYLTAIALVRILMIATLIAYLNHLTGYTLAALELQKVSLLIATCALLTNLILNFIFVPIYSYYASAWITIVTEGVVLVFSLTYLIKKQNLTPQLFALPSTLKNLLSDRKKLF